MRSLPTMVALLVGLGACRGNEPPRIVNQPPPSATEDVEYVHQAQVDDPDGPQANWSLASGHTCGGTIDAATGVFAFTPAGPAPEVSCQLALQVCDGSAREACATQRTTIAIVAVNDAPAIDSAAPVHALEVLETSYDAHAIDADGPGERWSLLPTHTCGGSIDVATGELTFMLGQAPPPTCELAIQVCDGGEADQCAQQLATVAITPFNNSPMIDSVPPPQATEGLLYTYAPTVVDPDGPDAIWSMTDNGCGGTLDPLTGIYTFMPVGQTPPPSCGLTIQVCDAGQPERCDQQGTNVTIVRVDDPPIAIGDFVAHFAAPQVLAIDVLANELDIDGGPRSIAAVTQPAHGTATIAGALVRYQPAPGYCNSTTGDLDTFTYSLAPGSSVATVGVWVACPGSERTRIATGGSHTCEVRADGSLWCWGANGDGQLGDGTTSERHAPTRVGSDSDQGWATVAAGTAHTCAVRTDGSLWCWGRNSDGQLGDGATTGRLAPVRVSSATPWVTVSAGATHTCATRTGGTLWCWGANDRGQLGDGTTTARPLPAQVAPSIPWARVSVGRVHSCGVATDGRLWCWGDHSRAQLGVGALDPFGTDTFVATPLQVLIGRAFTSVAAGRDHTCSTEVDGRMWCWGDNSDHQLGLPAMGPTIDVVAPGTRWLAAAAGTAHTCGLRVDGSLWCWGANASGALGDGTTMVRVAPTQVGGALTWVACAAGGAHTCGARVDGSRWCWGANDHGQLGDGTTTARSVPTQMP